jgi:hypothetical protein
MRLPTPPLPLLLLAVALASGCGSDESDQSTAPRGTGTETTRGETNRAQQSAAPVGVRARPCRDNGDQSRQLRVTGVECRKGERVAAGWGENRSCRPAAEESRSACSVGEFRCLATAVGRGLSVTCARPQRSIAFIVRR